MGSNFLVVPMQFLWKPCAIVASLVAAGLLASCAKPAMIEENCSTKGNGDVSCEFANKGESDGSKCVRILLKSSFIKEKSASRQICSGIVKAGDIVQRETTGGFEQSPVDFCIGVGDSWTDNCVMTVESDSKGESK